MKMTSLHPCVNVTASLLGHKLISVAFKLATAIAGLKSFYINLFTVANLMILLNEKRHLYTLIYIDII